MLLLLTMLPLSRLLLLALPSLLPLCSASLPRDAIMLLMLRRDVHLRRSVFAFHGCAELERWLMVVVKKGCLLLLLLLLMLLLLLLLWEPRW